MGTLPCNYPRRVQPSMLTGRLGLINCPSRQIHDDRGARRLLPWPSLFVSAQVGLQPQQLSDWTIRNPFDGSPNPPETPRSSRMWPGHGLRLNVRRRFTPSRRSSYCYFSEAWCSPTVQCFSIHRPQICVPRCTTCHVHLRMPFSSRWEATGPGHAEVHRGVSEGSRSVLLPTTPMYDSYTSKVSYGATLHMVHCGPTRG
jgi:hypothetical protein